MVSDTGKAVHILKDKFKIGTMEVTGEENIKVYEGLENCAQYNRELVRGGVEVMEIGTRGESLESYFTSGAGRGQRFTGDELFFAAAYSLSGIFFDLCILSLPFFICALLRSQALSMTASFGMIGLVIAFSQMPWTYIAMQAAERRFGAVELIYFLCFFLAVGILYAASLCYFKKQDIL